VPTVETSGEPVYNSLSMVQLLCESRTVRRDAANSRLNLAHHRVVARALGADAALIDEGRAVVDAWASGNPWPPAYVDEWRRLLASPVGEVRREIVHRTAGAERLRGCSPFALIPSRLLTHQQVRRFWRMGTARATRVLEPRQYGDYADHLKKLGADDRVLRFSRAVDDDWIDDFVERVGDDRESVIIGHYDADLGLDGALCVALLDRAGQRVADTGLSVLPEARHRGIGFHLLEHGLLWARNHGARRFVSMFVARNEIMYKMAQRHGMELGPSEEGMEGHIDVAPQTLASVSRELIDEQIAEWDYRLKAHRAAFSLVGGHRLPGKSGMTDRERLAQLVAVGGTGIIATYVIAFRYALIQSGASAEDHTEGLAILRRMLEPLVAHDPDLWTFTRGLPAVGEGEWIRYGLLRRSADVR
jgi:GNAT superfamily N-acetyltransferase